VPFQNIDLFRGSLTFFDGSFIYWRPCAKKRRGNFRPGDARATQSILLACRIQQAEKLCMNKFAGKTRLPSGAKAHVDFAGFMYGLKPVPFT
jgi:hypothetical protein